MGLSARLDDRSPVLWLEESVVQMILDALKRLRKRGCRLDWCITAYYCADPSPIEGSLGKKMHREQAIKSCFKCKCDGALLSSRRVFDSDLRALKE